MTDGSRIGAGEAVLRVSGPAPAVLGAERTMLNFLTHLSGIATATRAWADAIAGTGAAVRDTRKTTPGLRVLAEVRGAVRRRLQPPDGARRRGADQGQPRRGGGRGGCCGQGGAFGARTGLVVEVECDSVAQVREALDAGARFLLLDNMPLASLREAVAVARAL